MVSFYHRGATRTSKYLGVELTPFQGKYIWWGIIKYSVSCCQLLLKGLPRFCRRYFCFSCDTFKGVGGEWVAGGVETLNRLITLSAICLHVIILNVFNCITISYWQNYDIDHYYYLQKFRSFKSIWLTQLFEEGKWKPIIFARWAVTTKINQSKRQTNKSVNQSTSRPVMD